jgi:hypothetical protein
MGDELMREIRLSIAKNLILLGYFDSNSIRYALNILTHFPFKYCEPVMINSSPIYSIYKSSKQLF